MSKLAIFAVAICVVAGPASAQVHVEGYHRADGTYVPPYTRTEPNGTRTDNWSSRPNVNPITGQQGTKDPNAPKPPYNPYAPRAPRSW